MTVAAFVVSVVALLASGLSALYARRQATAAEQTAKVEAARRHEEERPNISDGEIQRPGNWYRLYFRLVHTLPLRKVIAEIVDTKGVSFRQGVNGVPPLRSGKAITAFYTPDFAEIPGKESLVAGDGLYWVIELDENPDDKLQIRLTCIADGGREWVMHREVEVPSIPKVW
ncbi:hypothetical protein [Amycolatopsis sp. NPDC054798]